ncbi:C45 family autoproteolytic acyltransferase/hydrolase [Metabacillus idriensis]|uniref:C45 family autoproteolytic acyltransferase/hydolase n=1 Tax=Metabacillus idriensis TaxID=324768 RepID=UPI002040EB7C|nr:C45 family peptidase [Metabacillus idriensis]MCM3595897.1 C45 family autoproteolytic acyltransferase/hydrolase [Metabacillus idriensis]
MMVKIEAEVIQGRGSYYDLGIKQGKLHSDSKLFQNHQKRRIKSIKSYQSELKAAKSLYEQFAPGLWQELEGLSAGLDWPIEDIVHEYSGYQADWKKSGCSALMQNGYYARNYDYHPKTYEGRFLIWQPENAYASIGFATRMIGRIDGMNEKGLVIGYHFVNRLKPGDGFICCSIARFILDTCKTTAEAILKLKEIPHRHAFNYSLYDAAGHAAIAEASSKGVSITSNSQMACTNHFESPSKLSENRHHLVETHSRKNQISEVFSPDFSASDAFIFFNSTSSTIFKKEYQNWAGTLHTAVYMPKTLQVMIGVGGDSQPIIFSFKEWLIGKDCYVKKIRGTLETNIELPF